MTGRGDGSQEERGGASPAQPQARIRIGSLRVDGFRNLNGVCLPLDPDLTVLLGENNTGKTSLLQALGVALGHGGATEDDLHLDASATRAESFQVHLTLVPDGTRFDDLTSLYLGDAIARTQAGRELAAIRVAGIPAADGSGILVQRTFVHGWHGCDDPLDRVKLLERPLVTRRILDLIAFTLLDAKRDLVEDLRKRRSPWGRLLARLDVPAETQEELATALAEVGDKIVGASDVLHDLSRRLNGLAGPLGSSINKVDLSAVPTRLEEVARALDVLVASPGGTGIPLRLQGMGSRSLAALMVFQAFIETRLGADLGLRPLAVTALEEPEAHLHPQAQAAVAHFVHALPGQKVVSTHSPRMATVADLKQVRFLRREQGAMRVRSSTRQLTPKAAHKLRRLVLRPLGELLFARVVIFGDGTDEPYALPIFARAYWGTDPEGMGIGFPELDGLRNPTAQALVAALEDLGIPWLALVDGDGNASNAIDTLEGRLGKRPQDTHELVRLDNGVAFERLLADTGSYGRIVLGLEKARGDDFVAVLAERMGLDKTDPDVVFKALKKAKGSYGARVAEEMVKESDEEGPPCMPAKVRELFDRADAILGRR